MAEAILFDLAGRILSFLASDALNQIGLPWYAKKELENFEKKITTIRNVLIDAQEQQSGKPAIKEWLRRLRIVLQEADDLFDKIATEALRRDVVFSKSKMRKVRYFFASSNPVLLDYSLGRKIKDISEKVDEFCADINGFKFLVGTLDKPIIKRNEGTTSFVDPHNIIGREYDKKILLQKLSSSPGGENVHVIPVVGMGGLGKTTLAQLIFNDYSVKTSFDKKVWACVSDDFNVKRILAEILTAVGENSMNFGMEQLRISFQEKLSGKKFFLVLDDVWNDDPVEWKKLEELLMTGARGSRVLVTTRDKKVAEIVCTVQPYVLKGLSDKECLSILVKWAFKKGEETKHPHLIEIGREIVKKCGGVPLAARTIGVLLYLKTKQEEWLSVNDSEMWAQVQNENSIISILKLSYDQMPSSLKKCFGYFSLFEKDEEIDKETIIYHWIAHGLIQSSDKNVELEDVCETYLEELLRRSFLEYAPYKHMYPFFGFLPPLVSRGPRHIQMNDRVYFKMHDLVHDLAQYVVGDESVIVNGENVLAASTGVRHVSLNDSAGTANRALEQKNLRTIMLRGYEDRLAGCFEEAIIRCGRLRVLDYGTKLNLLPKHIRRLKYLRYLRCHGTKTIPKSLCELSNLQFLDLSFSDFNAIPEDIGYLRNLRVFIFSSHELIFLPEGIRNLTSLRKLIIGPSAQLRSLGTGLRYITSLEHLEISSCSAMEFSNDDLQGLVSLKKLDISLLPGLKQLPMGLRDAAATLKHLKIESCDNLTLTEGVLPNIHSLEILEIIDCESITCFPEGMQRLDKLTHLKIYYNSELEERCKATGEDWPKIAHVPHVNITSRARYFS